VTISLSAIDNLSGVSSTEYSLDDGNTWLNYEAAVTLSQGTHTLVYRSVDVAGNAEQPHTIVVNIDKTAPETKAEITLSEPDGANGWYVNPVTISLSANDNLSGVSSTEYSLDGGKTWLNYEAGVTVGEDGKYAIAYRSKDQAGNVESEKTISFNLDRTMPEISVTGIENDNLNDVGDLLPVVTLNDDLSGVDSSKLQVTLDGEQYQLGKTIELYTLALGSHTFVVNGSDLAGNMTSMTVTFNTVASVEGLKQLVERFTANNWIDDAGISNSLLKKLEQGNLNSFVNEVEAQSGKHISVEAAGYLLRDASALLP
jgi:hypothetical protein